MPCAVYSKKCKTKILKEKPRKKERKTKSGKLEEKTRNKGKTVNLDKKVTTFHFALIKIVN